MPTERQQFQAALQASIEDQSGRAATAPVRWGAKKQRRRVAKKSTGEQLATVDPNNSNSRNNSFPAKLFAGLQKKQSASSKKGGSVNKEEFILDKDANKRRQQLGTADEE